MSLNNKEQHNESVTKVHKFLYSNFYDLDKLQIFVLLLAGSKCLVIIAVWFIALLSIKFCLR